MKKRLKNSLLLFLVVISTSILAQNNSVGIGTTTPDNSAILDLMSTNQGLLIPRNNTSGITTITTPSDGLILYNIDDKCYWFWNNSSWKRLCETDSLLTMINNLGDTIGFVYDSLAVHNTLITNNTTNINNLYDSVDAINTYLGVVDSTLLNKWDVNGNTGTNSNANFLGTIDNVDLVFRTNNIEKVRVMNNGRVGIGTNAPTNVLDINSNALRLRNGATANFVLITDATGVGTWQNPANNPLISVLGNDWKLLGNAGTNPVLNFLGTTDNVDLVFRTNNIKKVSISTKGQVEIFNTGFSVFIGEGAGANDDLSFNSNVFIGINAGEYNTTGFNNIGLGYEAFRYNTTGYSNVAVGKGSLRKNTTGYHNVAIGESALRENTTGTQNTALGFESLKNNTTAFGNSALGYQTLENITTGQLNTAIGNNGLINNTSGNWNTVCGANSLQLNTTGSFNSAYGYGALGSTTTMSYNTAIGSFTHIGTVIHINATSLGYNAQPLSSNSAMIGNTVVTSIGGWANWTGFSDGRLKTNVQENVVGLEFILKLRPVTYNYDMNTIAKLLETPDSLRMIDAEIKKGEELQIGFIAQEVEKAAKEINFNFHGVDTPKSDKDFYGLRYAEFVPTIVKAIQEQQNQIEELKEENKKLKLLLDSITR